MPLMSGDRPAIVVPKTTSSRPVTLPRTIPQSPSSSVLPVSFRPRAISSRLADAAKPSSTLISALPAPLAPALGPAKAAASESGSASPSSRSQAASAAVLSLAASQAKYSRYGTGGARTAAS